MTTHYEVLKVSPEASIEDIKAAFRKLALEMHPDKNPSSSDDEFGRIQQAWECLRDARQTYDEELRCASTRSEAKMTSAMTVKLADMEEAVDDETNHVVYVYACRCGDEVQVWPEDWQQPNDEGRPSLLMECPGCSFSYSIEK